jgi:hypothetical protein
LAEKPEGKRPLRKHRLMWEDNIKRDFRGSDLEIVDRIYLAQVIDRLWALVNTVMKILVKQNGAFLD